MSLNRHLSRAKVNRNDEFYTQYKDIEQELQHYKHHFKNKTVYCNCDDPRKSNFSKYFQSNFKELELKKLIVSCYNTLGDKGLVLEYTGDKKTIEQLQGNGDFRNEENIDYLKKADIIVTNPPFSLFREYVAQLVEYDKKFLVIGSFNAIHYKEIFPSLKNNKMWIGYNTRIKEFVIPENSPKRTGQRIDKDGTRYQELGNSTWYTNLGGLIRREDILLSKEYYGNEEDYPKYDNYDAIEVRRVANIPKDYKGIMGVPITFMTKYNPEQFEILGLTLTPNCHDNNEGAKRNKVYENVIQHSRNGKQSSGNKVNDSSVLILDSPPENEVYYTTDEIDGCLVAQYTRILIKNKGECK